MTWAISRATRQTIVAHARADAPRECCGLLVGRGRRVDAALPMTNTAPRPTTRFQIDPKEHIAVRRVLRGIAPALEVVGVYHSHPDGPAVPSPRDIAEANYPDWLYVIVGRGGRVVQAFQIREGTAAKAPLRWRKPAGTG